MATMVTTSRPFARAQRPALRSSRRAHRVVGPAGPPVGPDSDASRPGFAEATLLDLTICPVLSGFLRRLAANLEDTEWLAGYLGRLMNSRGPQHIGNRRAQVLVDAVVRDLASLALDEFGLHHAATELRAMPELEGRRSGAQAYLTVMAIGSELTSSEDVPLHTALGARAILEAVAEAAYAIGEGTNARGAAIRAANAVEEIALAGIRDPWSCALSAVDLALATREAACRAG